MKVLSTKENLNGLTVVRISKILKKNISYQYLKLDIFVLRVDNF